MTQITLFAQVIALLPKEIIRKIIRDAGTDKHCKGYNTWIQLVSMIFCQFSNCDSVRDISNGLKSATGNLNHPGISRDSRLSECTPRQFGLLGAILYVVPLFRTAGGLGAQRLPVQDAHQITGFHSGLADHIGLRLGALYHVKGCRKDAHIAWLRLLTSWIYEYYRW